MRLKDYGLGDSSDQEDLKQYSLKNFDLKTCQLAQAPPDPAPIPAPSPVPAAPEAASIDPPLAPDAWDVQFGLHFSLQQPLYTPSSPSESWKIPRWVVAMVGLFFGSAAVLTFAVGVMLLREPKAPPAEPSAVPTAAVVTASVAPTRPGSSSPMTRAPGEVPRAATANVMHDVSPPAHRVVVSRHPSVVRRQIHGSRRVASKSASSSEAAQETETASRRPPKDALDQLLSESTL